MKIKINDNEKVIYKYLIEDGNIVIIFQDISLEEIKLYFENMEGLKLCSDDISIKDLSEYKLLSIQISDMVIIKLAPIDVEKAEMEKKITNLEKDNQILKNCVLELSEIIYENGDESEGDSEENSDNNQEDNTEENNSDNDGSVDANERG
ncbi:MAG: hypothetical protein PUB28_00820 [Roseburia sp.]|nr:hypothetical protein [Roseburia sp.]